MIEQIVWTRLDKLTGVAGMLRRLVSEAVWHTRHRSALGTLPAGVAAQAIIDRALEV